MWGQNNSIDRGGREERKRERRMEEKGRERENMNIMSE
jgi:hypothetical protein